MGDRINAKNERQKERMAKKVTRYLVISEGFLEEEAICDPGLEGQTRRALCWVRSPPVY